MKKKLSELGLHILADLMNDVDKYLYVCLPFPLFLWDKIQMRFNYHGVTENMDIVVIVVHDGARLTRPVHQICHIPLMYMKDWSI